MWSGKMSLKRFLKLPSELVSVKWHLANWTSHQKPILGKVLLTFSKFESAKITFWTSEFPDGRIALGDFVTGDANCCHLLGIFDPTWLVCTHTTHYTPHTLVCTHCLALHLANQQLERKIGNPFSTNLEISLFKSLRTNKNTKWHSVWKSHTSAERWSTKKSAKHVRGFHLKGFFSS